MSWTKRQDADQAFSEWYEAHADYAEIVIRAAGYVSEPEHDDAVDTARADGHAYALETVSIDLVRALDALLRMAELGRIEEAVPSTDVLLWGPTEAALREALAIVRDTCDNAMGVTR